MRRIHIPLIAAVLLPAGLAFAADDAGWSHWRGPQGTGVAPGATPPLEWSEQSNIRWKTAIPGAGHSSPIVLGDRIYMLTAVKTDRTPEPAAPEAEDVDAGGPHAPESPAAAPQDRPRGQGRRPGGGRGRGGFRGESPKNIHEFIVVAVNRADGAIAWQRKVLEAVPHEGVHRTASFASISPVTDGKRLYASFGSQGIYALDLDGRVLWRTDLGDMSIRNSFGEGATPAVHGDNLIVPWDHEGDSFITVLDTKTGAEKWRTARDERTTWTSPVVVDVKGRAQVVLAGTTASIAYDLATGKEIWRCSGMTGNVVPTPIVGHGMIYLVSGFRGAALQAVKLDAAEGDITGGEAIAWSHDRGTPYIPSPLLSGRNLYILKGTGGILSCLDAVTGEVHFDSERIDIGNIYASMVGAAGRVYICDREGTVLVLRDAPTLEVLATNTIDEGINATPAIVGDTIYLRGASHLYCIGKTGGAAGGTGAE